MRRAERLLQCLRHGVGRAGTVLDRVRALPPAPLDRILQGRPILVAAPHPDDESLGCGGLIAMAREIGVTVHILVVTDGAGSHPGTIDPRHLRARRREETIEAAAVLGVAAEQVAFWDVPDGQAPLGGTAGRALGRRLGTLSRELGVGTIFASWDHDSHQDHVATYRYARHAAAASSIALFAYPVWAWMLPPKLVMPDIRPVGFSLCIAAQRERKLAAVRRHASQIAAEGTPAGFALDQDHLSAMVSDREVFIAGNAKAEANAYSN